MNDKPSGTSTTLASRAHCTKNGTSNGHFQISIRCDDDGVITAQFQYTLTKALGYFGPNNFSHADRTGCRNKGNTRVPGHVFAYLVITCNNIADTLG